MSIAIGSNSASKIYLGGDEVSKMYLGSDLVWGTSEPLPVSNGLIAWLDGKDIRTGDTRWYASNKVTSLYSGFNVAYSSDVTLVEGLCMKATGVNGGASILLASNSYTCDNPFYHVGMSNTSDMSIEIVFNISTKGQIFGATYSGSTASAWRYMAYFAGGDNLVIRAHNGSAWNIYLTSSSTTIADGNPHVLTYQKEGTTLRFYVDGVLDAEASNSALRLQVNRTGNLSGVGRYDGINTTANGTPIGNVYSYAIYNRALTSSEILLNKNAYFNRYNLS